MIIINISINLDRLIFPAKTIAISATTISTTTSMSPYTKSLLDPIDQTLPDPPGQPRRSRSAGIIPPARRRNRARLRPNPGEPEAGRGRREPVLLPDHRGRFRAEAR